MALVSSTNALSLSIEAGAPATVQYESTVQDQTESAGLPLYLGRLRTLQQAVHAEMFLKNALPFFFPAHTTH